jgi:hypothetical protein
MRSFSLIVVILIYISPLALASLQHGFLCLKNIQNDAKLLITPSRIIYSPSDPFECQSFEYALSHVYSKHGTTIYTINLNGSDCLIPGPGICREPIHYFVQADFEKSYWPGRDTERTFIPPLFSIGTTEDTCCARVAALVGTWVLSYDCPVSCNCSKNCSAIPPCLFRDVAEPFYGTSRLLLDVDYTTGNLTASVGVNCFIYPFNATANRLTVGRDLCEPGSNASLEQQRRICTDPEGFYLCSIRRDTVTLFYFEDECPSRTKILGATWHTSAEDICPKCSCPNCDIQERTQTQEEYGANCTGDPNSAACIRNSTFPYCFPTNLTLGCQPNHTITFTSSSAVENFLPQNGTSGSLQNNYVDPVTTEGGALAGELLALALSLGFDTCNATFGPSIIPLKVLTIIDHTSPCVGRTVDEVFLIGNQILGGCYIGNLTAEDIRSCLQLVNENFVNGTTNLGRVCLVGPVPPVPAP